MSTADRTSSSTPDGQPSASHKQRAKRGTIAVGMCGPCRQRKLKKCVRAGRSCTYETQPGETQLQAARRRLNDTAESSSLYEELIGYLRTLDPYRANDIYQRIRYEFDLESLLMQVRAGDLTSQLSLQPEVRFRYELPYIKLMPRELLANNPYLNTLVYDKASLGLNGAGSPHSESPVFIPQVVYLRPFHAAQFIDRLVDDAKPSLWTTVCEDGGIMRQLLKRLFLCEFNFMSALQKDYFLEDMVRGQGDFCSSLLVNAVMAYACVCDPDIPNRAEYWNPRSLTYKFLVEAKRLWELESSIPLISTVQAGVILNGISNLSGLDELGEAYRSHSIGLANRLGLYDGPIKATSERLRQGAIYTAWALFCWDALLAFSLQQAPCVPRSPHDVPPPAAESPEWYGQFWLQHPGHDFPISLDFGAYFEQRARLRVIMAQFCRMAYGQPESSAISIEDAYHFRAHMLKWHDSLPISLQAENIVLPAQLQLHMYYHHLIITIFEPFLDTATQRRPAPQTIIYEANRYFSTLFRLYYVRHGHLNMDIPVIISLIFAGIRTLEAIQRQTPGSDLEGLRSTLILCATGLYNQRRKIYLAHALYSAVRGGMRPEDVALLKQVPNLKDDEEALRLRQAIRSKWVETVVKRQNESDDDARDILRSVEDVEVR